MKYRKKPIIVEATQWFKEHHYEGYLGVVCNPLNHPLMSDSYQIETLEGYLNVSDGDFIITGIKGERYPCKPDIFEQTYEPVPAFVNE